MEEKDDSGFNNFNNDGSFMESFMKLQEEKKKSESTGGIGAKPKLPPLMTRKPLLMSKKPLLALKKRAPKSKLIKPGKPVKLADSSSDEEEKTQTKEPSIPLASSIVKTTREGSSVTSPIAPQGDTVTGPSAGQVAGTSTGQVAGRKRRRNRWSDGPPTDVPGEGSVSAGSEMGQGSAGVGGQQLTAEQLQQIKDQIEMNKMVAEIRTASAQSVLRKKAADPNQPVYEYDSDEETEGGTWEHKKRAQEMAVTLTKARELTDMAKGKHHIGDFLPPQELGKFIEKASAIKEGRTADLSDYREHKLTDSNVGFRLLQKAGWDEGQGLGEKQDGIIAPINQGKTSFDQAGVGAELPGEVMKDDNAFDTYRKRMMLAYRFRPNPLNNPRRPYY